MQEMVDAGELRRRSDELIDEVARGGAEYVLARDGRPEAALISYEELSRLRRIEQRARERWDQLRAEMAASSADYSEEEVAAEVEAARQEVWEARRALRR